MSSERNTEVHELIQLFSAMTLEDNVIQDGNIETAGQPTSHIDSAQISTTVDAMDIGTKEPTQAVPSYRTGFLETSQSSLSRNRLSTQSVIRCESRLSAVVRPDAMTFFANNYEEGLKNSTL